MFICASHTHRVAVFAYGIYHCDDGQLCDSNSVVTPSGPRPAEVLREAAAREAGEAVVAP